MSPLFIDSDAVQGETFLPRQILVLGGSTLRANSLGHLEQIESYAPGYQVRFGSLNYTADIHGDLIFDGFEPLPCVPRGHDEYDLALSSDCIQEIAPAAAPSLNPEALRLPWMAQLAPNSGSERLPVRSPEHCPMVELNRTHRDHVAHKAGARIRRRSSPRGCRP